MIFATAGLGFRFRELTEERTCSPRAVFLSLQELVIALKTKLGIDKIRIIGSTLAKLDF